MSVRAADLPVSQTHPGPSNTASDSRDNNAVRFSVAAEPYQPREWAASHDRNV